MYRQRTGLPGGLERAQRIAEDRSVAAKGQESEKGRVVCKGRTKGCCCCRRRRDEGRVERESPLRTSWSRESESKSRATRGLEGLLKREKKWRETRKYCLDVERLMATKTCRFWYRSSSGNLKGGREKKKKAKSNEGDRRMCNHYCQRGWSSENSTISSWQRRKKREKKRRKKKEKERENTIKRERKERGGGNGKSP